MNFAAGNHVLILIRPTSTQKNNYFNMYFNTKLYLRTFYVPKRKKLKIEIRIIRATFFSEPLMTLCP